MSSTLSQAADARAAASTWGLSWPLLVAAGGFLLALNANLLVDADIYWHVAAARWMADHFAIPRVDVFSHTMPGAPWVAHEWLAEVILGTAYRQLGWAGPVILAAAGYGAALAILCRYLLRHLEPVYALGLLAVAACLIQGHLVARPHALVLPLVAAWAVALLRAREEGRAPTWHWALAMALWANLHGSFPLGLALAGFFAVEAVMAAGPGGRRPALAAWGRFCLLALLAATLTPQGPLGLAFAAKVHGMSYSMDVISEWRSPDFHAFQPVELAIMAGGLAILLRGLRLPAWRAVLVLGLLHLALAHARHAELLGLVAPLALAGPLGSQWRPTPGAGKAAALDRHFAALAAPASRPATLAVAALLAVIAGLAAEAGWLRPDKGITPEAAVRAAREAALPGPVLNSYQFGGYLVFAGIPPFIDGRADMYGDRFLAAYGQAIRLEASDSLPQLLDRHHIGWTLLAPDTPALALLDHLPGWRRVYADDIAVVHVKSQQR